MRILKNGFKMAVIFYAMQISFSCGSSFLKLNVLFDKNPDLTGDIVYYKDFQIGKIGSSKLNADGRYFVAQIFIKSEYVKIVHSNSAFYIEDGKLNLYQLKEMGDLLNSNVKVKGFNSKTDLLLFQTKSIGEKSVNDFLEWANKNFNGD